MHSKNCQGVIEAVDKATLRLKYIGHSGKVATCYLCLLVYCVYKKAQFLFRGKRVRVQARGVGTVGTVG